MSIDLVENIIGSIRLVKIRPGRPLFPCIRKMSERTFFQPVPQHDNGLAAVADLVFFFRSETGEGFIQGRVEKYRVVAETAGAVRPLRDISLAAALEIYQPAIPAAECQAAA